MQCQEYLSILSEYIDERLDADTVKQLEAHIRICPQCAQTLQELKNTINILKELPRVSAPPDLATEISRLIVQENCAQRGNKYFLSSMAIAASLLLAVGLWIRAFLIQTPSFESAVLAEKAEKQNEPQKLSQATNQALKKDKVQEAKEYQRKAKQWARQKEDYFLGSPEGNGQKQEESKPSDFLAIAECEVMEDYADEAPDHTNEAPVHTNKALDYKDKAPVYSAETPVQPDKAPKEQFSNNSICGLEVGDEKMPMDREIVPTQTGAGEKQIYSLTPHSSPYKTPVPKPLYQDQPELKKGSEIDLSWYDNLSVKVTPNQPVVFISETKKSGQSNILIFRGISQKFADTSKELSRFLQKEPNKLNLQLQEKSRQVHCWNKVTDAVKLADIRAKLMCLTETKPLSPVPAESDEVINEKKPTMTTPQGSKEPQAPAVHLHIILIEKKSQP